MGMDCPKLIGWVVWGDIVWATHRENQGYINKKWWDVVKHVCEGAACYAG